MKLGEKHEKLQGLCVQNAFIWENENIPSNNIPVENRSLFMLLFQKEVSEEFNKSLFFCLWSLF